MNNIIELKKQLKKAKDDADKITIQSQITDLTSKAEKHIRQAGRELSYSQREWSIEFMLDKYTQGLEIDENELFIPDYQREYKWPEKTYSRFIESILLDFPIPYLYIADVDNPDDPELDGRAEVIDGSQRLRALHYFVSNQIPLSELKEIHELEGFYFDDLPSARKRRFLRESLRIIELKGVVDEDTRRNLFERINSGMKRLESMEVRHGSQEATSTFYKQVIITCSNNALFSELAPLSEKKRANKDHQEFALRFFAYLNDMDSYRGSVAPFLDDYLKKAAKNITASAEIQEHINQFNNMLKFIKEHITLGFRKTLSSGTTTRARYEALAVGTALALKNDPSLKPASPISGWILSEEFQSIVGADSANNTSQLLARINFVKNKLTGE